MLYFIYNLNANYYYNNCLLIVEEISYRTANDSIYEFLPKVFSREMLVQQCKMNNGEEPTNQKVNSMLFNWKQKRLIQKQENGYMKLKN